jgi:hypothetical protein
VEKSALATLRRRRFDLIAQTLDPRISRSSSSSEEPERALKPVGNGGVS